MADTLGSLINRVLRRTGKAPNKTALSDNDDTQFIADAVNEAYQWLYGLKPFEIDLNGTITITPSTRLLNGPANTDLYRIYDWSWNLSDPAGNIKIYPVTQEFIVNTEPLYQSHEEVFPKYIYLESGQLGIFPLLQAGQANRTLQFVYPSQEVRLVWATALPFPDNSDENLYCERYAQFKYELQKGLGMPEETQDEMMTLKGILKVRYSRHKRQGFKGYRKFS